MAGIKFDNSLIVRIEGEGLTTEDVERALAARLEELGYAKETFTAAILEREAVFPTALDMDGINVAIPHCDVANVNEAAVCMGGSRNPWRGIAWMIPRAPARSRSCACSP